MNDFITLELQEAFKASSLSIEEMTPLEAKFFREKMAAKFLKNGIDDFPIWERVKFPIFGLLDRNSHYWLDEFFQKNEVIMFFHYYQHLKTYIISKNQSISPFLEELPSHMVHFTNESLDYLLCFSDADYLIAAGTAEPWLRNKAIELSKTGWKDADGFYWDENGVKKR